MINLLMWMANPTNGYSLFGGSMLVGMNILISIPLSILVGYITYSLVEKNM